MATQPALHQGVATSETAHGLGLAPPPPPLPPVAWAKVVLVSLLFLIPPLLFRAHAATRRPRNYPPGPRCVPFLGNLASIPLAKSYVRFSEWSKQYGPILGLKAGPLNLVVLQDPVDIHELFDKRGSVYGGRPYNYIALNHVFDPTIGQIFLFQRNDRLLKRWKRTARWFLSPQGVESLRPMMDAVSARCVKALTERPGDYLEHLRTWSLSTPLMVLTGQADVDSELRQTYSYRQTLLTGLLEPGKTPPVDFIVPLRWVPAWWAKWKRDARFVREHQDGFYGEMMAKVKAARERRKTERASGQAMAGAAEAAAGGERYAGVMERAMDEGMSEEEAKWLGGGLLDAAFDTLNTTVLTFLVAMAAHENVLAKAQSEVEKVCNGRMPKGEDVDKMPYLKACMLETLRWRPSTPLGLPHVVESDDTYKGYVIPRGTNVVVNAYGMLHDPAVHRDPDRFDPGRYYLRDGDYGTAPAAQADNNNNDDNDGKERRRSTWVFGAGRRRCMGDQFALQSLMTVMAKVVWALDLSVPPGTDLSVDAGFGGGLVMRVEEHVVIEVGLREGRGEGVRREWERGKEAMEKMLEG